MPRSGPDDLLSAYFDHEVTPAERAAAEELLERDVAARQELEEIGGLSELLKSLPHETAPDFLLAAALQRAERETLFEHAAAPVAVARPRRRREWMVVLVGLLTTSAAVLLMVNTLPQAEHAPVGSMATESALVAFDSATPAAVAKSESAWHFGDGEASPATVANGLGSRGAAFKKLESEGLAESAGGVGGGAIPPARVGEARQNSFMLRTDPAPLAPTTRFAVPAGEPLSASTTPQALPGVLNFSDAPADAMFANRGLQELSETDFGSMNTANNSIRLGQVLPYLAMNRDGAMSVIEFTVIDVDQAADSLEVLLSRNDVKPRSGDKSAEEKSPEEKTRLNGLARKQSGNRSESLVAFYVQTGPELAGRVIRQLESEPWVVKVDLMPPVPGDELLSESTPVDARQIEEVLVRNGIQYGNTAMQNSAVQGLGGASERLDQSGSRTATANRPESNLGLAVTDRRRKSGADSPSQAGAEELQVMQRLELRHRPEVVQFLGDNAAEASKPLAGNLQKERELEVKLSEKQLTASNNIRMLFILQQNLQPPIASPVPAP